MAKILFVQQNEWQQLGILYLSGTLKKHGHQCELALGADYSELSNKNVMTRITAKQALTCAHNRVLTKSCRSVVYMTFLKHCSLSSM